MEEIGILKGIDMNEFSQLALGLSYAEVHKICEDIWKDTLLYGKDYISVQRIKQYISVRKQTY